MSHDNDLIIVIETPDIDLFVDEPPSTTIIVPEEPDVIILAAGGLGSPGPSGPEGPQGPAGPQGNVGPQGPAGGSVPSGPAGGVLGGTYPNPSFAADMATQAELDAHVNDSSAAHVASAVSYIGGTGMSATDVEAALDELATEKQNAVSVAADSGVTAHLADAVDAHIATAIGFTPVGTIAATTVQAAIAEAASEAVQKNVTDVYTVSGHSVDRARAAVVWAITNAATDRTLDANSFTMDELADAFGTLVVDFVECQNMLLTLVADLKTRNVIG